MGIDLNVSWTTKANQQGKGGKGGKVGKGLVALPADWIGDWSKADVDLYWGFMRRFATEGAHLLKSEPSAATEDNIAAPAEEASSSANSEEEALARLIQLNPGVPKALLAS